MKKNLLTLGVLAFSVSASAQILTHVGDAATFYVNEGALVYNGGGIETKGSGIIDLHGNMMIIGGTTDLIRTITNTNTDKLDGGNIVIRMNVPAGSPSSTVPVADAPYGQLFIDGIAQTSNTAIINKEYRTAQNGNGNYFQQVSMPFFDKELFTLTAELGKNFGTTRFTQNEILKWNNATAISVHYTSLSNKTIDPTGYYMLGSKNNDLNTSATLYTLKGRAYSAVGSVASVQLKDAADTIDFGVGGNKKNIYDEKYNTYLQDRFEFTAGHIWTDRFGRDIYQFGNPFFTNIDLSLIGYDEDGAGTKDDGNNLTNIWGIKTTAGTVKTLPSGTTYTTNSTIVTFDETSHIPIADVPTLIIKPMQTFVIKLRNNTVKPTLNFNSLRRFKSDVRAAGTDYSVTASKNASTGTVKQLGVIGLDSNGVEIARTYYVVSPTMVTGHQSGTATTVQAAAEAGGLKTFEEDPINGMYDTNHMNYALYINEANEVDFLSKPVPLALYNSNISSLKFEIRENAVLLPDAQQQLSTGIGFYYKTSNGVISQIGQNMIVPTNGGTEFGLSYGPMSNSVLSTTEEIPVNRTLVVYNPAIDNYVVQFDPSWKKADLQVYDLSGKLVISAKNVKTSQDFIINLSNKIQGTYIVTAKNEKGEKFTSKIIR